MVYDKYKNRCIQIITRSDSQKSKLEKLARKNGTSLSKYLLNLIESAVSEESKPNVPDQSNKLLEEIATLKEDLRIKTKLLEKYEDDYVRQRAKDFLEPNFRGVRSLDINLLCAIQNGPIGDYKLLDILKIDRNDVEMIQAVSRQLEVLEAYGMISKGEKGWRWKK